jgi:hypothetical protein
VADNSWSCSLPCVSGCVGLPSGCVSRAGLPSAASTFTLFVQLFQSYKNTRHSASPVITQVRLFRKLAHRTGQPIAQVSPSHRSAHSASPPIPHISSFQKVGLSRGEMIAGNQAAALRQPLLCISPMQRHPQNRFCVPQTSI